MNTVSRRRAQWLLAMMAMLGTAGAAHAAAIVRQGSGANTAALQSIVDEFRADLGGANNGIGGSFPDGRREVNWDGVPDLYAEPNELPPDFFNVNSQRGVVFHTVLEDAGSALNRFMVSATQSSGVGVRFGDINPNYATQFTTFSAQRLFMPRNAHALMLKFYQPGTSIPATTSGFGVVFTDVESATGGSRTIVSAYAVDGHQLVAASAPVLAGGLSFVGFSFDDNERIDHVIIKSGTTALGAGVNDGPGIDVVAMDDMIYGEPQPMGECSLFKDGFQCAAP